MCNFDDVFGVSCTSSGALPKPNLSTFLCIPFVLIYLLFSVELRGSKTPWEGNIFVDGLPVCDDYGSVETAIVVCRSVQTSFEEN